MARFQDYRTDHEVSDIMEKMLDKFPRMFEGFDVKSLHFIVTCKKKGRQALKLRPVGYPNEVFVGKPYIVEVLEEAWKKMTSQKTKNLAVFHVMCAIPNGGFDPASKYYGKTVRPQIVMYEMEFAAAGGVPNWMENPLARDPLEVNAEDLVPKTPDVESVEEAIPPDDQRFPVSAASVASV